MSKQVARNIERNEVPDQAYDYVVYFGTIDFSAVPLW